MWGGSSHQAAKAILASYNFADHLVKRGDVKRRDVMHFLHGAGDDDETQLAAKRRKKQAGRWEGSKEEEPSSMKQGSKQADL